MSRHEQKVARLVRHGLESAGVKFVTIDEYSSVDAKVLDMLKKKAVGNLVFPEKPKGPRRRKFKAMDVGCPKCGASPGEHCTPRARPVHSERWWDVQAAQEAYDTLLEIDR